MNVLAWAWYGCAVAAFLAAAALASDAIARLFARPTRWVWVVAIAGSIVVPWVGLLGGDGRGLWVGRDPPLQRPAVQVSPEIERWLLVAWVVASVVLLLRLVRAFVATRRGAREWSHSVVSGVPVRVAEDLGPAVVGIVRPEIVLPLWALGLSRKQRDLVVLHELEHRRAGDAWICFAANVAQALLPWNLPLWYQLRRLRLAVELDCDARVLRRRPDVTRYACLLLKCAAGGLRIPLARLALGGPRRILAHRIRAMTAPRSAGVARMGRALAFAGAALAGSAGVARVHRPPPIVLADVWGSSVRAGGAGSVLQPTPEMPLPDRVVSIDAGGVVTRVSGPPLGVAERGTLRGMRGPAVVRFTPDPDRPTQTVAVVMYRQGAS